MSNLTNKRLSSMIRVLGNSTRYERSNLVLVAHEGQLRKFESCGERVAI